MTPSLNGSVSTNSADIAIASTAVQSEPLAGDIPMNVLYDPYSPVAIILATCALVTAVGKVVSSR